MMQNRVVIVGGPRSGKTTLAANYYHGIRVMHTDDYIHLGGFEDQIPALLSLLEEKPPWVLEGVTAVRALRAWMKFYLDKPCDEVITCWHDFEHLSKGQQIMKKGCLTVWKQIAGELLSRGVTIRENPLRR